MGYLRRQRAKQAKLAKEKEEKEASENIKKQPEQINNNNKFDTLSLSGSDSGVSVKSGSSTKNHQKKKLNLPKVKTVQKYSFVNQGKLRASTDDRSVIGSGSISNNVFAAKPVSEPRTWSNSRLNRQQRRGRIGSRS